MRAVLIDIDVILDVLAKREPFVGPAVRLWAMVETKLVRGYLASHSITTLFYLIRKVKGNKLDEFVKSRQNRRHSKKLQMQGARILRNEAYIEVRRNDER